MASTRGGVAIQVFKQKHCIKRRSSLDLRGDIQRGFVVEIRVPGYVERLDLDCGLVITQCSTKNDSIMMHPHGGLVDHQYSRAFHSEIVSFERETGALALSSFERSSYLKHENVTIQLTHDVDRIGGESRTDPSSQKRE